MKGPLLVTLMLGTALALFVALAVYPPAAFLLSVAIAWSIIQSEQPNDD